MRWVVTGALTLLLAGCGARSMLLVAAGDNTIPPSLTFVAEAPVLVYEPSGGPPKRALDEGGVQIEWTSGRFAVLFEEQREESSAILVAIRFIDAETFAVSDTVIVSDQEGADKTPWTTTMAWRGDALGVLWSKMDHEVRFRRVGGQGELLSASSRSFGSPNPIQLGPLVPTDDGFALVERESDESEGDDLVVCWLAASGRRRSSTWVHPQGADRPAPLPPPLPPRALVLSAPGSLIAHPGGYAVAWASHWRFEEWEPDRVFVSLVEPEGGSVHEPVKAYETDNLSGASMVTTDDGFVVSVGDASEGIFAVGVDDDGTVHAPVKIATEDRLKGPLLERVPGGVAVLAVSADRPEPKLGTAIHFLSADPSSGTVHSRAHLNAGSPPECVVDGKDFARAGDSLTFGVVWVEQCDEERRMYFTRVTASP